MSFSAFKSPKVLLLPTLQTEGVSSLKRAVPSAATLLTSQQHYLNGYSLRLFCRFKFSRVFIVQILQNLYFTLNLQISES